MKIKGILTFVFCLCVGFVFGQNFTDNVIINHGSNPTLSIGENSTSDVFEIKNWSGEHVAIVKKQVSGNTLIDVDPNPQDGVSKSRFRFFRNINTTGACTFDVYKGDGTAALNSQFSGNGNTALNMLVGNVGIGTQNPTSKLSVNGKIESEEIQVVQDVADYVFEDSYEMLNLEELENYINKNGCLPRIQNRKEVEDNRGFLRLGDLSVSLMEKVEELTLHLIELNKRVNSLEKENLLLKEENKK